MSQSIAELCELLIKDNLGDLYATIFSYLFAHGRQPTIRIARATGLTGKQVRHALAVLVQQHLVYHSTSRDDGLTYYEADWRHAYYLVRSGRILQLVQDRLGEYAAKVMEVVMYLGHAKVSYLETMEELIAVPAPAQSHPEGGRKRRRLIDGAGVKQEQEDGQAEADDVGGDIVQDGFTGDQDTEGAAGNPLQLDSEGLHPTLRALASHGFIMRVRDAHFLSPGDLRETAEQSLRARSDIRALKGKRQEEAIASGIEELIRQRTDGRIKAGAPDVRAEARERRRKRAAAADTGPGAAEEEVEKARKRLKVELDDGEDDHLSRAASGAASANDVYGYEGDEDDYDEEVEPMDVSHTLPACSHTIAFVTIS
ncbi:RNA polymerase III subunit C82 [Ascosphaera acerosa]|nr:RNA polymerase III subunit C82 [Ascosphaera acerosa]